MSPSSTHCRLLRPSLMAHVYRERHPEERRLRRHLRVCSRCRREVRELAAARAWVEATFPVSSRRVRSFWRQRAAPALAAAGVVVLLAFPVLKAFGARDLDGAGMGPAAVASPAREAARVLSQSADTYDGDSIDTRLDAIAEELEWMRTPGNERW